MPHVWDTTQWEEESAWGKARMCVAVCSWDGLKSVKLLAFRVAVRRSVTEDVRVCVPIHRTSAVA